MNAIEEETINVSIRMPRKTHRRIVEIGEKLGVHKQSQMYKWICEAYVEMIDEKGEVHLPAVVAMARAYLHNGREKVVE
tara:strand:- start:388 stop:624 length:237 start_codon:yes stop_codon:yes gene_type:complete